jgi:hypothetical protein
MVGMLPFTNYINRGGQNVGFSAATPADVAPLQTGDVLGVVFDGNSNVYYYRNGLPLASVGVINNPIYPSAGYLPLS